MRYLDSYKFLKFIIRESIKNLFTHFFNKILKIVINYDLLWARILHYIDWVILYPIRVIFNW